MASSRVRWALVFLIGLATLTSTVLGWRAAEAGVPWAFTIGDDLLRPTNGLVRWGLVVLVAVLLCTIAEVALRVRTVGGKPVGHSLRRSERWPEPSRPASATTA